MNRAHSVYSGKSFRRAIHSVHVTCPSRDLRRLFSRYSIRSNFTRIFLWTNARERGERVSRIDAITPTNAATSYFARVSVYSSRFDQTISLAYTLARIYYGNGSSVSQTVCYTFQSHKIKYHENRTVQKTIFRTITRSCNFFLNIKF